MDTNGYALEQLARQRLGELRAQAELAALGASGENGGTGYARVARALVRAGRWLRGPRARSRRAERAGLAAGPRRAPCACGRGADG